MKTLREPVRFLLPEEMEAIHRNALRILSEVGMKIDHNEALDYLQSAGCKINREKMEVKFPEDVVQKFVDKMKNDFRSRLYPKDMAVRYSHIRLKTEDYRIHPDFSVSAGGYCMFIYDTDGKRRAATLKDTIDAIKLINQLDQISYAGLPVAAQDIPLHIRQIKMSAELVKNTNKLGGIEALNPFDIEYICRIGDVVRGSREELKKKPILIGYAEARSPLCIDNNMCEVLIEYVKRGMPQSLDTMPNAGLTGPMHPSGTLTLGIAETLGGMVLAYSVDPNACVTLDVNPSFSDLGTGIFKYSGSERVSLLGSRIQLLGEYYGCPSGVHGGKTDSHHLDVRSGLEKAVSMFAPVLCGAVGIGTVGQVENALTFSPQQLILDNEIARYTRRSVRGFEVTDESINVDLLKKVGIGGNYMEEEDTLNQFRSLLNLSPFFRVETWGSGTDADESSRWENKAADEVKRLLHNDIEPPLTKEQEKEIDEIVVEASKKHSEKF